ncbi:hypothetical protein [Capnocytophaga sp. H4358]|uniref:hypothetical protein n=1 Tax=Capnocytophaga sp. H4358 TaxID=1945658 RepID=UPI0012FFBB1D|nr:hypothetical protein [Capnocytophaga sp. H4358]
MICYLLLELIKRFYSDKKTAFSNFCEKIRVCPMHYLTLNYVCNELKPTVKKVKKPPENTGCVIKSMMVVLIVRLSVVEAS